MVRVASQLMLALGARAAFDLPFGDINVMIVTDVHSWIAGHKHEASYDATYGDVLSLYGQMKADCDANGRDLFFVMNGDINDGTGLGVAPPIELVPLLEHMPWDAVTIGNHELYENEFIEYITKPGGFVESFGDRYLTANVLNATTGMPLGRTHKFLHGAHGTTLLTVGILYEMHGHGTDVTVQNVADMIQLEWFQDLLSGKNGSFDAVMILGHMHYTDPLVNVILEGIRALQPDVPIQFVTGHSHIRGYTDLDSASSSFEAGHYLDTVGFASFPKRSSLSSQGFQHVFIDANRETFRNISGLSDYSTEAGLALSRDIAEARARMGLSERIGCAPVTYEEFAALDRTDSLWKVFLDGVISETLFGGDEHKVLAMSTGSARYNIYAGNVTKDDIVTTWPFPDSFFLLKRDMPGATLAKALSELTAGDTYALASYVSTQFDEAQTYDVYGGSFDTGTAEHPGHLLAKLIDITGETLIPEPQFAGKTSTNLWYDHIPSAWPCDEVFIV